MGVARDTGNRGVRREAELAARWAAGEWRGQTLRTERGQRYRLIFEGRHGGGAGPDFRDAVLDCPDGTRLCGDVELHLRSADWHAHGHADDPRYNAVVLHVVLDASSAESRLASGGTAPVVVLRNMVVAGAGAAASAWPCADLHSLLGPATMRRLLIAAGGERFGQRVAAFGAELARCEAEMGDCPGPLRWTCADRVLFIAAAEALGYGRDRAALRHAGERLLRGEAPAELVATASGWQRVERLRVAGLVALYDRWRVRGPWLELAEPLRTGGTSRLALRELLARLHVAGGCISPGRARILAANVVLPFACAYAIRLGDPELFALASGAYETLPGLPTNQITREMRRQLSLPRLPSGATAQQGLHHIWSGWCRDKRCDACPCNRESHDLRTPWG